VSAQPCRALRFTLVSGEPWVIDARDVLAIRDCGGWAFLDCGLMAYQVRESALVMKLRLDGLSAPPPTGQAQRVYHA